jgi:hypothetical protein
VSVSERVHDARNHLPPLCLCTEDLDMEALGTFLSSFFERQASCGRILLPHERYWLVSLDGGVYLFEASPTLEI